MNLLGPTPTLLTLNELLKCCAVKGKFYSYYRPDLELFLETDASSGVAIGMALLQSDKNERESLYPITYGSKTLTEAEN